MNVLRSSRKSLPLLTWNRHLCRRNVSSKPASSLSESSIHTQYCIDLVKKHDYEGYLAGLLMPKEYRRGYFALKAFNVEIATIKDQVPRSSQHAGRLRFNFWKDLVQQMDGQGTLASHINQPVAVELHRAMLDHKLEARFLERIVEARQADLMNNGTYLTYDDLEDYAEKAHSSLIYLILQMMQIGQQDVHYVGSHVGVCTGIVTLLRGYAFNAQMNAVCIPKSVLTQFKVSTRVALSGPQTEEDKKALEDATHDMASQAYAHLTAARNQYQKLESKAGLLAFLPAVSSDLYLQALERNNFDPFVTSLQYSQKTHLQYQLKIMGTLFKKTF